MKSSTFWIFSLAPELLFVFILYHLTASHTTKKSWCSFLWCGFFGIQRCWLWDNWKVCKFCDTPVHPNCESLKKCTLSPTKEHRWSQMCNWKHLATSATLRPAVAKAVQVHDGTAYQVVLDQWSIFQRGKWKCISTFPSARSDGLVRHAKFHLIIGFRHRRSHAWTSGIHSGPFVGDPMFRGCSDGLLRTFSTFSAFSTMRALQGRSSSDQNLRNFELRCRIRHESCTAM